MDDETNIKESVGMVAAPTIREQIEKLLSLVRQGNETIEVLMGPPVSGLKEFGESPCVIRSIEGRIADVIGEMKLLNEQLERLRDRL